MTVNLADEKAQANGKTNASAESNTESSTTTQKKHGLNPFQLKKRLAKVEEHIFELETKLEDLQTAIGEASSSGDAKKVSDLGAEYTQTEAELEAVMEEWELLAE